MDPDALREPPLDTLSDRLTVVTRGIVQDHHGEAMGARVGEVIERRDDLRAPNPTCMGVKVSFIGPIEQPQHIQPLPTAAGQFVGHPWRLPGIRDARDQGKAGGIKIEKLDLATGLRRLQPR